VQFGYVLLAAYWTILLAELIGDKTIYTVTSLTLRYRASWVFAGIGGGFAGKMLGAVLLGKLLLKMPPHWATAVSAVAFFAVAILLWLRKPEPMSNETPESGTWFRASAVSFTSVFFTEWGDPGQIAAAAFTVQSQLPLAAWLGGTLALMTKGGLAMTLGASLRDRLPEAWLRRFASVSCGTFGLMALYDTVFA
jgi:putative Ca2+/H+ antiporter (TMEM165/GDT1 family)